MDRALALIALLSVALLTSCAPDEDAPPETSDEVAPEQSPETTSDAPSETPPEPAFEPGPMRFTDIAAEAGLTAVSYGGGPDKDHILESTGSGGAMFDYDGDGHLDLYVLNAWLLAEDPSGIAIRGANTLYRNRGDGTFEDVTDASGLGDDGWACGVCIGDYDNDGLEDVYVTNFGPNRLFRNRGDGTFEELAASAGVDEPGWGGGAAFFDAEGDGDLDLYVANYIDCTMEEVLAARRTSRWQRKAMVMVGPFGLRGGRDKFFRNEGDGTFTDATDEAGMTDLAEGYGLGVLASDLDDDGDVDVYVANDSNPNYLYRNEGDGTFTDVGAWSGAGFSAEGHAQAGMGVDAGDYDGDGRDDLFVTHFARDYCTLYRNLGDLFFEDVTTRHEIRQATYPWLSWGCAFVDGDLDADLDLVIVNGHIYPQVDDFAEINESYRQPLTLLRNDDGRFVEVRDGEGPAVPWEVCGRGLAVGDIDDDGDLDLLVTAIDAPPLLLRNEASWGGHWLRLRLLNERGAHDINAKAIITAGGTRQRREVRSGSTYQSQNALDLHFGLGGAATIDSIEIHWSDGATTTRHDVAADQTLTLRRSP